MTKSLKSAAKIIFVILLLTTTVFSMYGCNRISPVATDEIIDVRKVKNLIIIIGDGMGYEHIKAGELMYGTSFDFTDWVCTDVNTDSYDKLSGNVKALTDSAASATALACGKSTLNGYVGKDHNGNNLETILDIANRLGKSTGILTTDKMYGATPAGFSAHTNDRNKSSDIISSQLMSDVNLLCSYTTTEAVSSYDRIIQSGYSYCDDYRYKNDVLSADYAYCQFNLEGFGSGVNLCDAALFSIDFLSKDSDGFVLMIEMAHIDKMSHNNNFDAMAGYVYSLNNTVNAVADWAARIGDTAIIVTADHETGGLKVSDDQSAYSNKVEGKGGNLFSYEWSSKNHSRSNVGCFIYGFDVDYSKFKIYKSDNLIKNTEIFSMMKSLIM